MDEEQKKIDEILNKMLKNREEIDEDELVGDDIKKEVKNRGEYKKKPCSNCNCNRAKEETDRKKKSSKCGNCYLGDAFRCIGCPYNGMPAFEPGEEMFFDSDDLNKV